MFVLYDNFNRYVISRHQSIETAVKAKAKFFRKFYRNNTKSSYLPVVLRIEKNGKIEQPSDSDQERFNNLECMGFN